MSKKDEAEGWLADHPGATAIDLAEYLDVNRVYGGQILAQLYKEGSATRVKEGGVGSPYHYTLLDGIERPERPAPRDTDNLLPRTIKFNVVAELKNGGLLLQFKGDFFVARMVDLADIVRI